MEFNEIEEIEEKGAVKIEDIYRYRQISRRSDVWEFMSREPKSRHVVCNLCGLLLTASSRSGTSNLRNHLLSRHADQYTPKSKPKAASKRSRGNPSQPRVPNGDGKTGEQCPLPEVGAGGEESGEQVCSENEDAIELPSASGSAATSGPDSVSKARFDRSARTSKRKMRSKLFHGLPLKKKSKPSFDTKAPSVLTNRIFRMLVEDLLPVSIVDGTGFRGLVDDFQRGCPIPTKEVLEELLSCRLKEGREKIGERLVVDEQKIGLTCDLWTDYNSRNYITLTANLISKDWTHESWILGTIEISSNTTDEDVSHKMRTLCLECGISLAAVVGVVYGTECGYPVSDITERLRVLKTICAYMSWECRPCTGELLGISVQNSLSIPPVSSLIVSAERLISHMIIHKDLYLKLCSILGEKQKPSLTVCDTSSRWEMIFRNFSQLDEIREPLIEVLDDKNLNLTDTQWKLLHEIVQALHSIKAAIAVMGDHRNKSLSCWLPVIQGVLQNIDSFCSGEDVSEDGQIFLNSLKTELQARCELNEIMPSSLMMQAAAVDPRFHHLRFLSDEDRVPVIDELKRRLGELPREAEEIPTDSQEDSAFFALLGEDEFNKKQIKPEDEIDLFRLERPVSRETDPLHWWNLNKNRFPGLAQLAKAILCVPAAATPLTITDESRASMENRKRLESAKNVDAQLFLHKNIRLFM